MKTSTRQHTYLRWIFLLVCLTAAQGVWSEEGLIRQVEIDAGALEDSLPRLARTFDIDILVSGELIAGIKSPKVSGVMTARQAIQSLLAGTPLVFESSRQGEFLITKQPSKKNEAVVSGPPGGTNPSGIEEILVKGELIDRSLQDSQSSVAVFTGESLDRHPGYDLFDIIDRTPGASLFGNARGFSIRGVADGGDGNRTVNISVDGAVLPTSRSIYTGPISSWDLEQVEIFRGPQSTQSGLNSLAGAINMRSKDPTLKRELKLRGDIGSHGEQRLAFAGNLPLGDRFAVRLSVEDYDSDGDIENATTGVDIAQRSLETYRAKLLYQPNDALSIVVSQTRNESQHGRQTVLAAAFPGDRIAEGNDSETGETDLSNLSISYKPNDSWTVNLDSSYVKTEFTQFVPADPNSQFPTEGLRFREDSSLDVELNFAFERDNMRATFGLYAIELNFKEDFTARFDAGLLFPFPLPPGTIAIAANSEDSTTRNYALFGEVEYDLNERWSIVAGARYDVEDEDNFGTASIELDPPVFPFPPGEPENLDADYDAFIPKLGVIYNWSEHTSTSFTIQQGYRAGGAAQAFDGTVYEFDPEFTDNYEFALRSTQLDGRLRFNANVFFTNWKDQQVFMEGPSGTFIDGRIENSGKSELYGFELETNLQVSQDSELYLNVGYSKTEYKKFETEIAGTPIDLTGNEFADAPRWTAAVGGYHHFGRGWILELDANFTDHTFATEPNDSAFKSDSYVIVNAKLGYESDRWSAHLFARNLFDREYVTRVFPTDNAVAVGDSRVVGFSLIYDL
ncbi:MAG: TonB-dependent receptor [Pseudomonadota bacterium]